MACRGFSRLLPAVLRSSTFCPSHATSIASLSSKALPVSSSAFTGSGIHLKNMQSAIIAPCVPFIQKRGMSKPAYTKKFVRESVLLNLKLFDKINPEKLTVDSHFHKDLGLDSLDHVEIIMAIEDEFGFEIPDMDAQKLLRPSDIVQYVCDKFDVFNEDEHHGHDDHGDHGHDDHGKKAHH